MNSPLRMPLAPIPERSTQRRVIPASTPEVWSLLAGLRARREALGLSRTELGERLGHHYRTVSDWEIGFNLPSLPTFVRWARALGFSVRLDVTDDQS